MMAYSPMASLATIGLLSPVRCFYTKNEGKQYLVKAHTMLK
jgi:hypothetical protein